jgi:hypothetical protein
VKRLTPLVGLALLAATAARSPIAEAGKRHEDAAAVRSVDELVARLESFRKATWTANEVKNVDLLTRVKPAELSALLDAAQQLAERDATPETSAAAAYVVGAAYLAYSDIAFAAPVPRGLSTEEIAVYQTLVSERFVLPAEDKAKSYLVMVKVPDSADAVGASWSAKTLELLRARYPHEYPSDASQAPTNGAGDTRERAGIEGRMRAHDSVRACVDASLTSNPSVAGKVVAGWNIVGGRVTSGWLVDNATGDARLGDCIVRAVRTARFGKDVNATVAGYAWDITAP